MHETYTYALQPSEILPLVDLLHLVLNFAELWENYVILHCLTCTYNKKKIFVYVFLSSISWAKVTVIETLLTIHTAS